MNADELRTYARTVVIRANDGVRAWRMAYPSARLTRAGDHGSQIAVDAVWEAWLCDGNPRWWAALQRWRRPADPGSALNTGIRGADLVHRLSLAALDDPEIGWSATGIVHAAEMTGHPISRIARGRILELGENLWIDDVCLAAVGRDDVLALLNDHRLAPIEPSVHAAYLLLTGRQQDYWELDPDQRLLVRAYRERPDLRPALRDAMPRFGDVNPVRTMGAALTGVRMDRDEVAFLSHRLAEDRDWDGLWRLARDLPPADAVMALRRADPDWRPPGSADAELHALLRTVDEQRLHDGIETLDGPRTLPVSGLVVHGAFSTDDRMLAVVTLAVGKRLWVFDLERGTPPAEYPLDLHGWAPVSFEGHRPIVSERWPDGDPARSTLWRIDGGRRTGRAVPGQPHLLLPVTVDGATQITLSQFGPNWGTNRLMLARRNGPPVFRPPNITVPRGAPAWAADRSIGRLLATDPLRRRVAFSDARIMVAELARGNRLRGLAVSEIDTHVPQALCLGAGDQVFTSDDRRTTRWLINGGRLEQGGSTDVVSGQLAWVPYRDAVLVDGRGRGFRYLDADTLQPLNRPGGLDGMRGESLLWGAANGSHAAGRADRVDVVLASAVALADLARRPMSEATAADHKTLAAARRSPVLRKQAGILLDILEANHLGRTGSPSPVPDDR
ncbi:hypothetical protein FHR83_003666 [Actinoplanes campanulatus]|uniref:Uncharacterized protein n=1 Tax=Actinoplanes campanulatus TaxID=113559 RepID=A0A7W5FF10_9ACTN|nr:hypothetical protein [Actinoplanes campanulatus]MBB3095996.1 hypothetical protein [Actinoplanes campanulatus]GGN12993.1 hypothetical protein GCM10010109_23790 [Actinoplanes campanulatus]GID36910.1 hypothetical protein Aca09nite_34160 [Actinoplanes campanulatus]